ncbi:MAG: hypothetical protein ACREPJ_06045 [Rhodanobacteraceae bacterium]
MLAGAVLAAMFTLAPAAQATPLSFSFSGNGGSVGGSGHLMLSPDPNAPPICTSSTPLPANAHCDPAGAQAITGADGTFFDAALGMFNVAITGVQPLNSTWVNPGTAPLPGTTQPLYQENLPISRSMLFTNDPNNPTASYDNLFYAGGSPLVCLVDVNGTLVPTYPFSGGFLDIYGVMFTLDNGDLLGLWSIGSPSGYVAPGATDYGFSVLTPLAGGKYHVADYAFAGTAAAVPEPRFVWALGAGLLGLLAWRRSAEKKRLHAEGQADA